MTTRTEARSLDQSLISGIAWTGIVKWVSQALSWAATLLTVRILAPTDYGLFGMAMVYVGLAQIVTEAGISAAVIQRPVLTDDDAHELAGMSIIVGLAFVLLTLALATPIARFFDQPAVRPILSALSAIFLIRSVQLVPRAMLARELRFRAIAVIEVTESLVMVVTTFMLALEGWQYWALVAGNLVSTVATTAMALRYRRVRPAMPTARMGGPVKFTWHVTVSQVSWYAYTNADFAVVGRLLGSVALGSYTFAWTIANIAGERVSALVGRVTPPLFAAVQGDPAALRRYLGLVVEGIALLTLPASVGLCLVADEFVPVVAGERWAAAIEPLRILALYAAFRSIFYLAPQLLIATGRARSSMNFGLLATAVLPPAFVIGARWGTTGVATAWVIVYPALALLTYVRATLVATQMTWRAYWASLWPAARATLIMALVVVAVRIETPSTMSVRMALLLHVAAGALTYTVLVAFGLGTRLRPLAVMLRDSMKPSRATATEPVITVGTPSRSNRMLLMSYHFAPSSAVGALRWQKLVRLAAERGWEFDVIARAPTELRAADPSRLAELPPGTRVYGVAARPSRLSVFTQQLSMAARTVRVAAGGGPQRREGSIRSDSVGWLPRQPRDLLRAYFAWLDVANEARWAKDAAQVALAIHEPGVHRAIVTCGPPHEPHLAGVAVAEATGLPLILDFRDPWSLIQRLPEGIASPAWLSTAASHERRAVRAASLVVANTAPFRSAMASLYPAEAHKMIAITNGCDEEPVEAPPPAGRFVIAYAGSIYLDRDPRPLFAGVARAVRELGLTPSDLSLEFMGEVAEYNGVSLCDIASQEGIAAHLVLHPSRPRAEALAFLAGASVLALLPQDSHLAIPAKLFDYMRCDGWIIAITEARSATGQLLRGTGAYVVPPNDVAGIADAIRRRYAEYRAGRRGVALATNERFSRRFQADQLFGAIEAITGAPSERTEEEALCAVS